eukprot:gene28222-34949_t
MPLKKTQRIKSAKAHVHSEGEKGKEEVADPYDFPEDGDEEFPGLVVEPTKSNSAQSNQDPYDFDNVENGTFLEPCGSEVPHRDPFAFDGNEHDDPLLEVTAEGISKVDHLRDQAHKVVAASGKDEKMGISPRTALMPPPPPKQTRGKGKAKRLQFPAREPSGKGGTQQNIMQYMSNLRKRKVAEAAREEPAQASANSVDLF